MATTSPAAYLPNPLSPGNTITFYSSITSTSPSPQNSPPQVPSTLGTLFIKPWAGGGLGPEQPFIQGALPAIFESITYTWPTNERVIHYSFTTPTFVTSGSTLASPVMSGFASIATAGSAPALPSSAWVISPSPTVTSPQSNRPLTSETANSASSINPSPSLSKSKDLILSSARDGTETFTPPAQSPPVRLHRNGLSSGKVAGVAIGCFFGGVLIGCILLLLWRRRSRARLSSNHNDRNLPFLLTEKEAESSPQPKTGVITGVQSLQSMEDWLPQPLEDKAISADVLKIENLIKNHVQSFYHDTRVNSNMFNTDGLQSLGNDLPVSSGTLSMLLSNPSTREVALRFSIAWVVVSRMQFWDDHEKTFVPAEISQLYRLISSENQEMMRKWRVFTANLFKPQFSTQAFSASDSRNQAILEALEVLEKVLYPYADPRMEQLRRRRNLEEILKRSAAFTLTLFSQPSTWRFDWKQGRNVQAGSLCVFPALVQVTDEFGRELQTPIQFSEAVMRPLDDQ